MYSIFLKEFSLILGDCEVAWASIINVLSFTDKRSEVQRVTPNLPQAMGGVTVLALNLTSSFQI